MSYTPLSITPDQKTNLSDFQKEEIQRISKLPTFKRWVKTRTSVEEQARYNDYRGPHVVLYLNEYEEVCLVRIGLNHVMTRTTAH